MHISTNISDLWFKKMGAKGHDYCGGISVCG